jgi:hypothetical protein
MQAMLMQPLPSTLALDSERPIADTTNPQLARRFASGLQSAGVAVSANGNVTLSLAVSVEAPSSGSSAAGGKYQGLDWTSGDPMGIGRNPSIRSAIMSLSVTLTSNSTAAVSWLATINCTVSTDDPGALAEDLGAIIGRAIGQNFGNRRI